jgi:hypothetical protein
MELEVALRRRRSMRLFVRLLPVVLVAVSLVPASASAQGDSEPCTASVSATQDPRVAAIEVDCGGTEIDTVDMTTSDQGSLDENSGTTCSPDNSNTEFRCEPEGSGSVVSARFDDDVGGVCVDPRLTVDFSINFVGEGGEGTDPAASQNIENVEVSGCENSGTSRDACVTETTTTGDRGDRTRGEPEAVNTLETRRRDDECAPSGGVDSGAGGGAEGSSKISPPPAAAAAAAGGVLILALLGVALRAKLRTTR